MAFFNFTKVFPLDLYHDLDTPTNDPKIKGYFLCFLVKPDLNLPELTQVFNSNDAHNILYGNSAKSYNFNDQFRKIFRGIITQEVRENLTHDSNKAFYFSNIFTNMVEAISYPDLGFNSEDTLITQDKNIFKLPVTQSGNSGMTFSVRMRENEGHDSLRFLKVWYDYIKAVSKGNLV